VIAMPDGTVKFYNEAKGYGFITCDDYRDIFMHISQWVHEYNPRKGDRVKFIEDVGRDRKPYARQIVVVK
jgi:cold shock CspA family protein